MKRIKKMNKKPNIKFELDSKIVINILKNNFKLISSYFYKLKTDWSIAAKWKIQNNNLLLIRKFISKTFNQISISSNF
jgi:hypothetical protein